MKSGMLKKSSQTGQALVEYALAIVLIMGIFFIINQQVLKGIGKLWKTLAQEIASACPDCERPPQFQR